MFYHCVHFWLRQGITDDEKSSLEEGLKSLADSATAKSVRVGVAAQTPREVVDNSYDYQLLVTFDDKAGHDAYQDGDPVHDAFVDKYKTLWTKVLIYDSLEV